MENFPEFPKTPKPVFIGKEPIISPKNPVKQDNSLSTQKVTQKGLEMLNKEISLKEPEKFLLNNTNKKSDQLKISQSLTIIANNEEKPTEKETVLLTKIKLLEEQLKQTTTERDNLKQLVQQEKQRANQAEQQLQKISQQLEQKRPKNQAQIIQPLPLKLGS